MKKVIWTLDIGNYAPELKALTRPFLERWAEKCGAEVRTITERKWPEWPAVYEKLQIFELGRSYDWNIYVDSDALVHPDFVDITEFLPRDTVLHYGCDFAPNRFRSDEYFRRSGRQIGSCNWFAVASGDCMDLWHPNDLSLEEAVKNITPTTNERNFGMEPSHLIDDYTLSRNIARFGLKVTTLPDLLGKFGLKNEKVEYLWHEYVTSIPDKIAHCKRMMYAWGIHKEAGLPDPPKPIADIDKARSIFGWMSDHELSWLAAQAKSHKIIVEIGSFQGRSTRALADNTLGVVYAVDTWEGAPEQKALFPSETQDSMKMFMINMLDHIQAGRVFPLRGTSLHVAREISNEVKPDMIFIDAAHDYESVKADIEAWLPKLAEGGLICGHDFGPNADVPSGEVWGVDQAVKESFPDVIQGPGSIWYVPSRSGIYKSGNYKPAWLHSEI